MAVDGTFLKASAHRGTVHTKKGLAREIDRLESQIAAYFDATGATDDTDTEDELSDPDLVAKITA